MILTDRLAADYVDVTDESLNHATHDEAVQSGKGHYRLVVVSSRFTGKTLLERHRMIYDALKAEFQESIHALTIQAFTSQEWDRGA